MIYPMMLKFAMLLIAVPIVIQVYFNSGLTYLLMRRFRMEHKVASPGALIGASNFFELAVAVAITLFGADSPAALAAVVGVLVEAPVMLSVCKLCHSTRGWYESGLASPAKTNNNNNSEVNYADRNGLDIIGFGFPGHLRPAGQIH
jgi:hypothetical protein